MNILRKLKNLFKGKRKRVYWAGKFYECDNYEYNSDDTLTLYCGSIIRILESKPALYNYPKD